MEYPVKHICLFNFLIRCLYQGFLPTAWYLARIEVEPPSGSGCLLADPRPGQLRHLPAAPRLRHLRHLPAQHAGGAV